MHHARMFRSQAVSTLWLLVAALMLSACASLPNRDPLNVDVAGIDSLPSEGMELRLAVKLRIQNPNDVPVDFSGAALKLELNDRSLASGVSDQSGSVPRYGETLVMVPVTISALDIVQQFVGFAKDQQPGQMHYRVEGKLEGGLFGTHRFSGEGKLDLSGNSTTDGI